MPEATRSVVEESPVSVAALQPPAEVGSGLVMNAPASGLVMVDGVWREYQMVRGHMMVQPLVTHGAGSPSPCGLGGDRGGGASMCGSPPPPPNPPTTPKASTPGWGLNVTPGGTPIPPPPPTTPLTTSTTTSAGFGDEVEEPSKLVTKLPSLPTARGGDAAVIAGDWLAQLEPSMSTLSPTAAKWWSALMERVKDLYGLWLESAPVARLTIRQQVLTRRPPPDRHHRVEQRAAMLLLDALPEELRHEAISARAVTAEAMVFMVHCAYQPGGAGEKAHLLQFLTVPETGNGLENTLNLARKWIRLFRRGRELQVVLPDPSLLCRGLDKLISATFLGSGNKHPSASFRIASFKLERQLEYRATTVDIEDYAYLILGELEAAQLSQPPQPQPKVARLDEQGGGQDGGEKGKGKAKGKKPCWGWQDGTGCRFGSSCLFLHAPLGPGRCWECGSESHLKPQCPLLGQGGKASNGGGGKGAGSAQAGAGGSSSSGTAPGGGGGQNSSSSTAATSGTNAEEKPPRRPRKKGGGKEKDRGPKDAVRKTEEENLVDEAARPVASNPGGEDNSARVEFFEEATKALKSLRLAKITLKALQSSSRSGGRALVDSGATTSMRTAREGEVKGLPLRTVLLAEGETAFYQLPGGTLLTTRSTAPIVAMSDLMEIGCRATWCSSEGCTVTHPAKGDLGVRVVNGCPEVDEAVGLELIAEAENIKLRRREAEVAVNRLVEECRQSQGGDGQMDWELGAKATKDLYNGVGLSWAWLHKAFPEAPSWLVSAIPVVAGTDGDRVPWNRHERKKWRKATAVAVHLFCGRDRSTWKSRAEVAHVITVDQAEDVMADATYAALLDVALSGKLKVVFGGPPCRTFSALRNRLLDDGGGPRPLRDRKGDGRWGREGLNEWETWRVRQDTIMIFRMVFLWMVAAAVARANGDRDPDFIMEHPEDPLEFLEGENMTSLWAFPEIQFLKEKMKWCWWKFDQGPLGHPRRKPTRVLASVQCPKELWKVRGPSTVTEEERDHDGDGFRSATWAAWAPGLKGAIKNVIEESLAGSTLEKIMKLDQSFLDHLQRDHVPFRRDCKACLAGAFRGHAHRRIVSPEAWCLSLDVIGPTRQGTDEYVKKVRYALIGTLVVPDMLGKLLQPPDPDGVDDGAGVAPLLGEDPICDEDYHADEEAELPPVVEEERSRREMEKWEARVKKDKLNGVSCVEVPFVVTMGSKSSSEVLAATKDMLVQVKKLGLTVQRIHSDRGREFICKGFRALCRDRGIVRTTTPGDDFRANGRVEALVGRAKNAVRTYLSASGLGADMWGFAMRHYVSRVQHHVVTQLGGRLPRLPPFGTKVFVKQRSWKLKKEEFVEKVVAARVLRPSMDVAKGFLVRTEEGSYLTTMVAVENVKEVSGEFEVDAPPARADAPGVRRRLHGKTSIAMVELPEQEGRLLDAADLDEHLRQDEALAAALLEAGDYTLEAVEKLLEGLHLKQCFGANRRSGVLMDSSSVSVHVLGMFRHGGVVGATNLARTRPCLTRYLVEVVKRHADPETTFTTLSLNFNTPMQCHKDVNNQTGKQASLLGFGNYVGGALWCHEPGGDVRDNVSWHKVGGSWLPGRRHPTYHKNVVFDPCQLHQPLPWQGYRVTVTAYTVGCADNCNEQQRHLLLDLGFPLPPRQVQASKPEGGEGGDGRGDQHISKCVVSDGCQGPGENQNSESRDGVAHGGPCGVSGCQGPGENQKSESRDGVAHGGHCVCKGWEVDPSLCLCRPKGAGRVVETTQFYDIGDDEDEVASGDTWLQESWGAYGPPMVATLAAVQPGDGDTYEILATEVPLEVGWDLFEGYLDGVRCLLVEEENQERAFEDDQALEDRVVDWAEKCKASRLGLETEMVKWQKDRDGESEWLCGAELVEESDAPLHTKTIPNEVVRREINKWVPSMLSEYESLVRENDAVEPFSEETLEQWKKEGREFDLVPGKTVHTVKAFTGRLKTRAVICGNFLGQNFSKDQKYAAGADGVLTRILLRMVALMAWSICVIDVRTAFLLAPLLFQEDRPTLVQVPKMFSMGGVCKETIWRVKRALYGMVTSPRSWEVYRNKTLAQMRGAVPEGEVRFVPSEIDGSLWYIMVGTKRAGAILCYVDDLLIAGERVVAKEASRIVASTWKCSEPQWDDVAFNGFEIQFNDAGMVLRQDSYTKDLLARYKDLEGYEEVPAPLQLNAEDFDLKNDETAADFVRTAQTMAGELQWLAGRCRPEILYAVNLLSQAISKRPKEAVYRGGHLMKYLKRYPEGGIFYALKPQLTPDAQVSSAGVVIEGFCDASFAPNSGRSQQAIMVYVLGGLVAWTSSRQAFVTMSTAESELVAICELVTCMKSVEQLVAEVMLSSKDRATEVIKAICSDSQAALAVCRCAAGSWRTRHLRIRGSMVRELLESGDWMVFHTEGRLMLADLGTKALPADRFGFLVDRMRVLRKRYNEVGRAMAPAQTKKLIILLCLASVVEQTEATRIDTQESFDYLFFGVCVIAIVAVWECLKSMVRHLQQCCRSTGESRRAEGLGGSTGRGRAVDPMSSDSPGDSSLEPVGLRRRVSGRKATPPPPSEPLHEEWRTIRAHNFVPTGGRRDYWEIDEDQSVAIRYHPTARLNLFVPGQAAGGPPLSRFTGERRTVGRLPSGQTIVHLDDFTQLGKPAQLLASKEWKGVTELRLKRTA